MPFNIRPALESDIPTLLTIFLTSFRLHPLFTYLHFPLQANPSLASDTIFFWRRRLKLFILDPRVDLVVLVVPRNVVESQKVREVDEVTEVGEEIGKSWEMLRWAQTEGGLGDDKESEEVVVGFATWAVRKGLLDADPDVPTRSWIDALRGLMSLLSTSNFQE
jgi:hypothetical protein